MPKEGCLNQHAVTRRRLILQILLIVSCVAPPLVEKLGREEIILGYIFVIEIGDEILEGLGVGLLLFD